MANVNRITALTVAGLGLVAFSACASDEAPADDPVEDVPDDQSRVDVDVDDGVDTNVEKSGNLEFDEPDEG